MTTIDLTVEKARRANAIKRAKERNIVIPTYAQMKDPSKIPANVKEELKGIGLWDIHPRNPFRINWHNEPCASGGTYGGVNYVELPPSLTGGLPCSKTGQSHRARKTISWPIIRRATAKSGSCSSPCIKS